MAALRAFAAVLKASSAKGPVWVHPRDYAHIRQFGRDVLDITPAERWKLGHMCMMWGREIWVSQNVERRHVYIQDEGEPSLTMGKAPFDPKKLFPWNF